MKGVVKEMTGASMKRGAALRARIHDTALASGSSENFNRLVYTFWRVRKC